MDNIEKINPDEVIKRLERMIEKIEKLKEEQKNNGKEFSYTYSD
jgi:uncharacterized protein (UPF0335 family)